MLEFFNNWIVLAVLAGLFSNAFNFFNRYILKDDADYLTYAWFYEALRIIIFLCFLPFDRFIDFNLTTILWLLGYGLLEVACIYTYMKMHAFSHLSISTILSRTRIVWIPLIAFFFLSESLNLNQYLGIVVIFAGVSVAVAPHKLLLDKGARFANIAAFLIALETVVLKIIVPMASATVINIAMSVPSVLIFPIFMKNFRQRISDFFKKNLLVKIVAVIANVISSYLLVYALQKGDVSRVMGIYQGMMIVSVLGGIIILKEKEDILRKILGTAITLIGVLLLT